MTTVTIVLLATAALFLVGMVVTGLIGTRPNGNILLGVSLPNHALEDEAVISIVKQYTRVYMLNVFLCVLLVIPVVFIGDENMATAYFMLWCLVTLFLLVRQTEKCFARIYDLKVENEWWVGPQGVVAIDTSVSRLKDTFMVSARWFFLPLAVLGALIVIEMPHGFEMLFWPVLGLGVLAMHCVIFFMIGKVKSKTYSEDTAVNLHLNHMFKRAWSRCMVIMAVLWCMFCVLCLLFTRAENTIAMITTAFVLSFAILVVIVLTHDYIRTQRNRLLQPVTEQINRDEDQYWIGGIFYNNPNDVSIFVEKRIGIGFTMNIGTPVGKLILLGVIIFVVAAFALPFWLI